jgi:hypothetical protein
MPPRGAFCPAFGRLMDDVHVDHRIDLDELARRLEPLRADWERFAQVGPFTWRDEQAAWPQPIVTDRASVKVPESLGIRLQADDDEVEIVVWTGGWADIDFVLDGEGSNLYAEFQDVDGAYAAVARNVEGFLA